MGKAKYTSREWIVVRALLLCMDERTSYLRAIDVDENYIAAWMKIQQEIYIEGATQRECDFGDLFAKVWAALVPQGANRHEEYETLKKNTSD